MEPSTQADDVLVPPVPPVPPPPDVVLLTVTVMAEDVVRLPARSRAIALRVCGPLAAVVEFQARLKGAEVTSLPTLLPSRRNWTPTTPTLSDAFAETVTAE